jgi:hypothetical protein
MVRKEPMRWWSGLAMVTARCPRADAFAAPIWEEHQDGKHGLADPRRVAVIVGPRSVRIVVGCFLQGAHALLRRTVP